MPNAPLPPAVPGARPVLLLAPALLLGALGLSLGASPLGALAFGGLLGPVFLAPTRARTPLGALLSGGFSGGLLGACAGLAVARHGVDGLFIGLVAGSTLGAGWGVVCAELALGRRGLVEAEARAVVALGVLCLGLGGALALVGAVAGGDGVRVGPALGALGVALEAWVLVRALVWGAWWRRALAGQQGLVVCPLDGAVQAGATPMVFPEQANIASPRWWSTHFLEHRPSPPHAALVEQVAAGGYRAADQPPAVVALLGAEAEPGRLPLRWGEAALVAFYTMGAALLIVGIGSFGLAAVTLVVSSGASTY